MFRIRLAYIRLSYSTVLYQVVGPELVSAVITLSNIESEIAFFHAYSMRALSIAASVAGLLFVLFFEFWQFIYSFVVYLSICWMCVFRVCVSMCVCK